MAIRQQQCESEAVAVVDRYKIEPYLSEVMRKGVLLSLQEIERLGRLKYPGARTPPLFNSP